MRTEPTLPAQALAAIRAPMLAAGAQATDAPILQPLNLLLDLVGEAMRARLFIVQAEGGSEACLRPDFTVAIARSHIDRGVTAGRYVYEGAAFRASAGSDEPEEFLQLGLEVFEPAGGVSAPADAEIVTLAWRAAQAGGRDDLALWLGDVGLFAAFIESLSLPTALAARLKPDARRPASAARARPRPRPAAVSSRRCCQGSPPTRPRACSRMSGRWPACSRWADAARRRSPNGWSAAPRPARPPRSPRRRPPPSAGSWPSPTPRRLGLRR
jgi:ATP phosphoribosyltransferase regulatory subunit